MTNTALIDKLKHKISETLSPLIDSDYVFLDLPYYSNIGDTLIWQGTEDFLKTLPFHCLYRSSLSSFEYRELSPSTVILMQGGGNFGDLYYRHNEFRNKIIKLYPNNKIIILPQTVFYKTKKRISQDAKIMSGHKYLYICARDKCSFSFLEDNHFGDNILLLPDMAFWIDSELLKAYSTQEQNVSLVFQRKDKEKTFFDMATIDPSPGIEYSDWPLYKEVDERLRHLEQKMFLEKDFEGANRYAIEVYMPARVREGIAFISKYNKIYSNRLHGSILSILLNKEVTIIDNSYGKNAQFYDTWLKDNPNIHLLRPKQTFTAKRIVKIFTDWMNTLLK